MHKTPSGDIHAITFGQRMKPLPNEVTRRSHSELLAAEAHKQNAPPEMVGRFVLGDLIFDLLA